MWGPRSLVTVVVGAIATLTAAAPVAPSASTGPAKDYTIGVRTLVLSGGDNGTAHFISQLLQSYGHPYDVFEFAGANEAALNLVDDKGNPKYGSIVMTDSKLYNGSGSALSDDEWAKIRDYRSQYSVRAVSLASSTWDHIGVLPPATGADGTDANADLSFNPNSPLLRQYAGSVKVDAVMQTGQLKPFLALRTFWYPSTVDPAAASNVDVFMYLNCTERTGDSRVPAGLVYTGDGLETMHFLINANEFGHHGPLLAHIWLPWLTRGIFIGQRRFLLGPQVDDVFLSTTQYVANNAHGVAGKDDYRINATELELHKTWLDDLNAKLPASSRVLIELCFNGVEFNGYNPVSTHPDDELAKTALRLRENFFWVSHTFNHESLTCFDNDCEANGPTPYASAFNDIEKNREFANSTLFAYKYNADGSEAGLMTVEERNSWPTYSNVSMVTPMITGLLNPEAIKALIDNDYFYVVGDNSRVELQPPASNPYTLVNSPAKDSLGRVVEIIPRYATAMFYDTSLPENAVREYNDFYGPNCYGHDQGTLGGENHYMCSNTTWKSTVEYTIDDILYSEQFVTVRNLLLGRADGYMFHQGNMRVWENAQGQPTSLLMSWIHVVTERLTQLVSFPIYTLKMQDLLGFFKERMQRAQCGVDGTITYVNGQATALTLTSTGECTAKVTRAAGVSVRYADDATMEELYGTDFTRDIVFSGESKTVTLPLQPEGHNPTAPFTAFSLPYPPATRA